MRIECGIELRDDADGMSPGRLVGTLVTYGAETRGEVFEPGSLTWPADGIVINRSHNGRAPILRVVPEVRGRDVVIEAPIPDTSAGRDAAREVRDGLMVGMSVEFKAIRQVYRAGVRRITQAALLGAGLVPDPFHRTAVEVRDTLGTIEGRRLWL